MKPTLGPCCDHNPPNLPPPGEPYSTRYCRICWLRAHREDWKELCGDYPPPRPMTEWPWFARALAAGRAEGDKGLGDTVARALGHIGGDVFQKVYRRLVGKSCGCKDRQAALNRRFPYP